jgi:hypothetical protein
VSLVRTDLPIGTRCSALQIMLALTRRSGQYALVSHAGTVRHGALLLAALFVLTSCPDTAPPTEFGVRVSATGELAIAPLWCEARPPQTVESSVRAVTNNGDVLPAFASGSVEVRFQEFTSLGTIPHELLVEEPSIDGVPIRSITIGAAQLGGIIVDLVSIRDNTAPLFYADRKKYETPRQFFASRCPSG